MQKEKEITIIGGGLAGLTAAVYLGKAGYSVTLFEKSKILGGRAGTTEKDGILFNMGAHALYQGGPSTAILKELEIKLSGHRPVFEKSIGVREGESYILPGSAAELFKTTLLNFRDKLEMARCLSKIQRAKYDRFKNRTWIAWLDGLTTNPRVKALWLTLSRTFTYTNAPESVSAALVLYMIQLALRDNVEYLDGGWQTIVDKLREKAAGYGVEILSGKRVIEINPDLKEIVTSDGETISSDAILLAVGPKAAAKLLPTSTTISQVVEQSIPVRAGAMNIALSHLPNPKQTLALGIDQPIYMSVHSVAAKLAPEGISVIHLLHYSGDQKVEPAETREMFYNLMDTVQPGWRQYLVHSTFLPDMIVNHRLPTAVDHGFDGRPSVKLPEFDCIFVAGDWVGDSGWLADASFASGKAAAEGIAGIIESASLEKDLYARV